MSSSWELVRAVRERVATETGPAFAPGSRRVAHAYPSPYRVGMSSLGFQWILAQARERGLAAERVFLPDDLAAHGRTPPFSYETETPLGDFPLIAVSLAYELEIADLIRLLELAGIPPLREDRGPGHPAVILGGPLTFSNPLPAAPFVDAMLLGEADDVAADALEAFFDCDTREAWLTAVAAMPGGFVPGRGGPLPPVAKASDERLPARSMILAPEAELSSMFLLEGERGCHRQCTFCVMRRSTNGGMRLVTPERVLSFVPDAARKVGLVGAAISDHPKLLELLEGLVGSGRTVSLSSLRADRIALRPRIAELLRAGGARTLTVASDAASQRLRREISKGTTEQHLVRCAEIAAEQGFEVLKVYMMLGLPGETDDDIEELIRFTTELAKITKIALGVSPFVAKRNTPLDGEPFAGISLVEKRIDRVRRALSRTRAELRPASARWAWVEHVLAQGGPEAGLAVYDAVHAGGAFSHYKRAFSELEPSARRPWAAYDAPVP